MTAADGLVRGDDGVLRCWWGAGDELYRRYHDTEWGRPEGDDGKLFEKLCLEGFQSGLSWLTILRKRESFRSAFAGYDARIVAGFTPADVDRLLEDRGIVRNRAKIESTIHNARRCSELAGEFGSLAAYVWGFEPEARSRPPLLDADALRELKHSAEATAMSRDMRKRGWSFVGPTTLYSFMQAMGLVNDHLEGCAARTQVEQERRSFERPPRPSLPRSPGEYPAQPGEGAR